MGKVLKDGKDCTLAKFNDMRKRVTTYSQKER